MHLEIERQNFEALLIPSNVWLNDNVGLIRQYVQSKLIYGDADRTSHEVESQEYQQSRNQEGYPDTG